MLGNGENGQDSDKNAIGMREYESSIQHCHTGAFHEQGSPGGEKMTIFKSQFSHDITT